MVVLQCIYLLVNLPKGLSCLCWCPNVKHSLRQVTYLKVVLGTTELALITQRAFLLRLFSVILLPLCVAFSWHHVTIASIIKFAFCKMTGCTSLTSRTVLFDLPPILRTPSVSRKESNLKRLLDLCIAVFDFNEEISQLNECCCSMLNIFWAFSNSSMFIIVVISEGLRLLILLIHTFAANSTTAIIFLIIIQLEDIISSFDVTAISAFTVFSWSLFFNSDQRKAGPLIHLCILLKLSESSPRDASSAGLLCVDTYCHCWTSVWSQINSND